MIQLIDLHKWYQMGEVRVEALDWIILKVERGEFIVVLGPSGSGKTTMLNMIGALDAPSGGEIWINGSELGRMGRAVRFKFRRETAGFVFQTFNLFPSLTALENVQFVLDVVRRKNGSGRRAGRRWRAWDCGSGCITSPTSCRAASNSGWRLRRRWPRTRR